MSTTETTEGRDYINSATYAARWVVRLLGIVLALGFIAVMGWAMFQPLRLDYLAHFERGGWGAIVNHVVFYVWYVGITGFVVSVLRWTFKWADNIGEKEKSVT